MSYCMNSFMHDYMYCCEKQDGITVLPETAETDPCCLASVVIDSLSPSLCGPYSDMKYSMSGIGVSSSLCLSYNI